MDRQQEAFDWASKLRRAESDADRLHAMFRLSQLGYQARPALGAVIEQLEHEVEMIRKAATNTIWFMARKGVDVLPYLRAGVKIHPKPKIAVAIEVLEFRIARANNDLMWSPPVDAE